MSTICWSATTTKTTAGGRGAAARGQPPSVTSRGWSTSPDARPRCAVSSSVVGPLPRSVSASPPAGPPGLPPSTSGPPPRPIRWPCGCHLGPRAITVCASSDERPSCPAEVDLSSTSTTTKLLSAARRPSTDFHLGWLLPPSPFSVSSNTLTKSSLTC